MKTAKITFPSRFYEPQSLYQEIKALKKSTPEKVKQMYGDFGLDIYNGKSTLTILSEKEKNPSIMTKIKTWFTGKAPADYEECDSLLTVLFKYVGNKEVGLEKDIQDKFGEQGIKKLESLRRLGYVDL